MVVEWGPGWVRGGTLDSASPESGQTAVAPRVVV
jgi:hypothetical protein